MSEEKKLTCTTCSGDLILDKERNLYKCPFCGVAYGYALFDGTALEKAEKSLSIGEFNDADLYFSFALSTDPINIRAHRGRVFCAGKWKTVKDISKTRKDVTGVRAENVNRRCDEAIKNLTEEQGKYFQLIKETLETTDKYNEAVLQGKKITKKRDEVAERVERINSSLEEYRQREKARRTRNYGLTDLILRKSVDPFIGDGTSLPEAIKNAQDMLSISRDSLFEANQAFYKSNTKIANLSSEVNSQRKMLLELNKELFQEDVEV